MARAAWLLATGLACAAAHAQELGAPGGRSAGMLLLQALLSLAIVVGVIYLAYYGLRRLSDRQLGADAEGPLRVVQAKHLGADRWLYVVQIGRRTLVVGGAPGQVTPVADLGDSLAGSDEIDDLAR